MAVYFLSDSHLGSASLKDEHQAERHLVALLESIRHDAEAIYLVGDIIDYWYEYRYVVPRGFVRFFGKLAELADAGIRITWLIGNHDIWIFDYLPNELGIRVADGYIIDKIDGQEFFISHGDGVGRWPTTVTLMRKMFRNRVCQWLFAGIHPRWTMPFAFGWSRSSRKSNEQRPDIAESKVRGRAILQAFSLEFLAKHPSINWFVYGHLHDSSETAISENCRMVVLGDWMTKSAYARYCDGKLELMEFTQN